MNDIGIRGILETILYSKDLPAMRVFYSEVLGLEEVGYEPDRHVFFRCGDSMLLIFDPDSTQSTEVRVRGALIPQHGSAGAGHVAFAVEMDQLDSCAERLEAVGVEIESRVQWYADRPRVCSVYFRDPAGNSLELSCRELWTRE